MRRYAAYLYQASKVCKTPAAECSALGPAQTLACLLNDEQHASARALHMDPSRHYSALPEYAIEPQHDSDASEHLRRLKEMEQASSTRNVRLPSSQEVRERLQSHSAASCSSSPSPAQQEDDSPSLDWREVVYRLRLLRQPAEQIQDQMLTDTFGRVSQHT